MKLVLRPSYFVFAFCVFFAGSCSQPILESPNCIAARDTVKRLYSIHLDPEGSGSEAEHMARLKNYISDRLLKETAESQDANEDYLTKSEKIPKAARVGACSETDQRPQFEVLLFWRRGESNIEKSIIVTAMREDKVWVVDKVTALN